MTSDPRDLILLSPCGTIVLALDAVLRWRVLVGDEARASRLAPAPASAAVTDPWGSTAAYAARLGWEVVRAGAHANARAPTAAGEVN